MHDITLISTRHENIGECNSHELWRILEAVKPQVIFQEIPSSYLNRHYIEQTRSSLETDAIRLYIDAHKPIIVAVDIDDLPNETFFSEHKRAVERVERLMDVNGFNYCNSIDANKQYTATSGFKYLNSDLSISYGEATKDAIVRGLEQINDDSLTNAYKAWLDVHDKRENEMLQNIYDYSRDNSYDRAVFLLGAAHRKSIINKIQDREKTEAQRLNWIFYGD